MRRAACHHGGADSGVGQVWKGVARTQKNVFKSSYSADFIPSLTTGCEGAVFLRAALSSAFGQAGLGRQVSIPLCRTKEVPLQLNQLSFPIFI